MLVLRLAMVCALAAAPPARVRLRLPVKPSPAIESRVREETARAERILAHLDAANALASPWVVSALYYRDGFLDDYPEDRPDANPSRRIVAHAARLLTPELKSRYLQILREACSQAAFAEPGRFVVPVSNPRLPKPRRSAHKYALDLFAPHGSPVRSATSGLVVLAEGSWTGSDPLSTSSQAGGNAVIVFDPVAGRFCRYCHLATVAVAAGSLVEAGQEIGTLGHTGANAARRGHGGHLHFEINRCEGARTRPLTAAELRALLKR